MSERVFIGPSSFGQAAPGVVERIEESGHEVVPNPFGRRLTREEVLERLDGVTGLIAGLEPLDRGVLESSTLKVISRVGSGMSNIDLDAARELGIVVYSTPDGPTQAVAELTIGGALAVLRGIARRDRDMRSGQWNKTMGSQLGGKRVAVIGYGRIGRRVASLLAAFGCEVRAVDPNVADSGTDAPLVQLEEALPWADIVALHVGGEDEAFGGDEFALMRDGAYLLNASRGGVVDEQSLVRALDDGKLAGAWIDVFLDEPYDGPLLKYENVVLTPHVGSYAIESRSKMEHDAVDHLLEGLSRTKSER